MNRNAWVLASVGGLFLGVAAFTACARNGAKDVTQRQSESGVVTNDNGSVSRVFSECTVTTNGNLVTEHRRETRTTLDTEGNMLETSTSEYAQSYNVGDVGMAPLASTVKPTAKGMSSEAPSEKTDVFLGLRFGAAFAGTNLVADADEPSMLRATFKPAKPLAGFDDYYVYVTPKTHRVAKVYACAKEAVDPGARWRRHYLIEALEKRYHAWARLCSFTLPCYAFDIGDGRCVRACLAGATPDYETVVAAWDENVLASAAEEAEALREAARKSAAEQRQKRVEEAAAAF